MLYDSFHLFLFFKQKTAYEMRISDWSSDVCSSDLGDLKLTRQRETERQIDAARHHQAMLAHACRGRERIAVRTAIAAAEVREIEREGFAEEAVLDRLGVGVGCVEAPRRGRRIILGDLEIEIGRAHV